MNTTAIMPGIKWDTKAIRLAHGLLRAVDHKLRQRMLDLLGEGTDLTVTEIYIKLRLEQSVASQHLAILRRAKIVIAERKGKFMYYTLDRVALDKAQRNVANFCNG